MLEGITDKTNNKQNKQMATYNKDSVVFGDGSEIPTGVYTIRITKMEKTKSKSSGNLMIKTSGEIIDPPSVEIGDKTVAVAGRKPRDWYNILNPESNFGVGRLIEGLTRGGLVPAEVQELPEGELFDDENLQPFIGKCLQMTVRCTPKFLMRPPTEAERAEGKKEYQQLTGKDGKPLSQGFQLETDWSMVVGPADDGQI